MMKKALPWIAMVCVVITLVIGLSVTSDRAAAAERALNTVLNHARSVLATR